VYEKVYTKAYGLNRKFVLEYQTMRTETALKVEAIDLLLKEFGVLDTQRFIASIKRSNFDYIEWRKNNACLGMTVEEISKEAMKVYKQEKT
jgi:hypothetical protein